jgi:CRP-like cAMP-binding protein
MSLDSVYLFQEVSEQTRSEIARIAIEESHAQGAFLFHAEDPADFLYVLLKGRVRLSVARSGLVLSRILSEPGDAIGWSSMAGSGVYTASAECSVPVKVMKINKDGLNQILEKDPASGLAFFKRLAMLIGQRLVESYGAALSVQSQQGPRSYG